MNRWLVPQQQLLSSQIKSGVLPHAILISGIEGSGKLELAQWLIGVISCISPIWHSSDSMLEPCKNCKRCLLLASNNYPDHKNVVASGRSISVDDIRIANQFFEKTAQLGKMKSVTIEFAEKMTTAAANALLKTLEEPSGQSLILLLTTDVERLLPTIISRCRQVSIQPPVGDELLNQLKQTNQAGQQGQGGFVNLTHLAELTQPDVAEQFEQFRQCFESYLSNGNNRADLLAQFDSSPHSMRWVEKIVVSLMRQAAQWQHAQLGQQANQSALPEHYLRQVYNLCVKCNRVINSLAQANALFEFEKLLNDIAELKVSAH